MSTPTSDASCFHCPHCRKRLSKDDRTIITALKWLEVDEIMFGEEDPTFRPPPQGPESVPCPACGKPIDVVGIAQGRFDPGQVPPGASAKGCAVLLVLLGIVASVCAAC